MLWANTHEDESSQAKIVKNNIIYTLQGSNHVKIFGVMCLKSKNLGNLKVWDKGFPRLFQRKTTENDNDCLLYNCTKSVASPRAKNDGFSRDNSYIILYNSYFLFKYKCDMALEVYMEIEAIECLFKYMYKDNDCATILSKTITSTSNSTY